ncbi:ImmA/IrrE family metallo-endopeptidase [Dorea sp. D27]|uniref:ImmA/IrrE family metallo-endopeptidase n=1 Tax=Dorea sp. D27 TaxID=658665 RepID=UPI0006731DFF|nr:ImmA/IrrE family metallo-endopeptidase [Dorea sp. D27]KMZ52378.1 pathogenicity island protein [Dorea sp. D27]
MNRYEELLGEAAAEGISIDENYPFSGKTSGLYVDNNIALSSSLNTTEEKTCVLAEELGHHHTSVGNIVDLTTSGNRKQERQARVWAYNRQIGLKGLIRAYEHRCSNRHETARYLEVTEEFLQEALDYYCGKYGTGTIADGYYIMFIPNLIIGKIDFTL